MLSKTIINKTLSLDIKIAASNLAAHLRTREPLFGTNNRDALTWRSYIHDEGAVEWCTRERAYLDKLEALHTAHHVALVALRDRLAPPCDLE